MAELFRLVVVLRQPQANVVLNFHSESTAELARLAANERSVDAFEIMDDFGNRAAIERKDVSAVILTEVAKDMEAQKQFELMRLRAQAKFQREVQADPMIPKQPAVIGNSQQMPPFMRQ